VPRTVLVADPDTSSRERVAAMVRDAGYRVLKASTHLQTMSALEACPIDGVVIDAELLLHCSLRRLLMRTPVLILSVWEGGGIALDVARVSKSVSRSELEDVLLSLIGKPKSSRLPSMWFSLAAR
jgi:hypothetical protein